MGLLNKTNKQKNKTSGQDEKEFPKVTFFKLNLKQFTISHC